MTNPSRSKSRADVYIHAAGTVFIRPTEIFICEEVIFAKNTIIATGPSPRIGPHAAGEMPNVLTNNNF